MSSTATQLACETDGCDRTLFRRIVSGTYTAIEYFDTEIGGLDGFEEEDIETTRMDDYGWECAIGHPASAELSARLNEAIEEL